MTDFNIFNQSKREIQKMKCWYKSKDPILRLKPQKVERIWMNPQIYLLRDIITDSEIAMIKKEALPNVS